MSASPAAIRVLVCDGQALARAGYATIFGAHANIEVVAETKDGRDAVKEAALLRPDVVVMDVQAPGPGGVEATRLLAGPGVAEPVKVLVVAPSHRDEWVYGALRAGASGFLLKQASAEELVAAVRAVARGQAVLAPAVTRPLIGRFAARLRPVDPAVPKPAQARGSLTRRELEVLGLIANGMSNAEIAGTMVISQETVKTFVSRILGKLGVRDRVQAVIHAYQTGLVSADVFGEGKATDLAPADLVPADLSPADLAPASVPPEPPTADAGATARRWSTETRARRCFDTSTA
jgi:DNA-binding NarL/FixJ family response regulator